MAVMLRSVLAFALGAVLLVGGADAQTRAGPLTKEPPTAQTYEARLFELSRVLGGAHYLRILCTGRGDQTWRETMSRLIGLEAPDATARRAGMVDAFNQGYRAEEERFPECSPESQVVEAELKSKGRRLSQGLAAPYKAE